MANELLTLGEPLFERSESDGAGGQGYLPGFGGDTSNVAVAAARQGAPVGVIARLGEDAFGDRFLKLWRDEGIDTDLVTRDPDAPTGIYLISYDEGGHEFSYYRKGSASSRMTPSQLPEEALANASILHLSGITQAISESACDAAFRAIEIARENRVAVSYDTNLRLKLWPLARARAIIMASVSLCDYCLPSLEDGRQLTNRKDPHEVLAAMLGAGARTVLLKLGRDGVLIGGEGVGEPVLVPPFPVEAVDATGAGDCFDGAFLARTLAGDDVVTAARYANAAAALSTLGAGAVAPIPVRAQVERFIAERS